MTVDWVLAFRLDYGLGPAYYSWGEGRSMCKGKISALSDFFFYKFLAQLSLGKTLTHLVRNFYNLGYSYWVQFVKLSLEKMVKPHAEQLHAHN